MRADCDFCTSLASTHFDGYAAAPKLVVTLPPPALQIADPALVRDVIRTNQGSMMMALLLPLHRFRIWVLRYLLAGVGMCGGV